MNTNDADLIQRILDGDEGAFTALVNKYQKPVHALVWRKIGDFHTAEEITQDVFLKVYKRLSTLKRRDHFPGWLYVIATRHCIAWLRKKQLPAKSLDAMSTTELEEICYAQYEADRDEEAAIEHRREIVKRLLQKLPESERTVVTLFYLAEMTGEEISVFLGVSPSTVRSRLHRARRRLEKEETVIQEVVDNFQLSPHLTENIMREVAHTKPTSPSVSKPWVPWALSFSATLLVILVMGFGTRSLSRFQHPYSLDATSEMTVELIDAPVVLELEHKSDTLTRFGRADIPGKNSSTGFQADPLLIAAAQADETNLPTVKPEWIQTKGPGGVSSADPFLASDQTLYAITKTGLYRLTEEADAWTFVSASGPNREFEGVMAEHDDTAYLLTPNELLTSIDEGKTWNTLGARPEGHAVALVVTDTAMYLILKREVFRFRSGEAGKPWEPIGQTLPTDYVPEADNPDFRPSPAAWDAFAVEGIVFRIWDALAIDNTLFIGTSQGLFRFTDDWEKLPVPTSDGIKSLAVAGDRLYVGTIAMPRLPMEGRPPRGVDVEGGIPHGAVFSSTDLGDSWTNITPEDIGERFIRTVEVVTVGDTLILAGYGLRSQDGGKTWMTPERELRAHSVFPAIALDENNLYGGGIGIRRSTDGGTTWHPFMAGIINSRVRSLVVVKNVLYALTPEEMLKSADGGESWEPVGLITRGNRNASLRRMQTKVATANGILYVSNSERDDVTLFLAAGDVSLPLRSLPDFERDTLETEWRKRSNAVSDKLRKQFNAEREKRVMEAIRNSADIDKVMNQFNAEWRGKHANSADIGKVMNQFNAAQDRIAEEHRTNGTFTVTDDTVFMEYRRKLYRWRFGEITWHDTGLEDHGGISPIVGKGFTLAASGNTVYVGKREGDLFLSQDGGDTWSNVTANLNFPFEYFKEILFGGSTVYVSTDMGVTSSPDGETWDVLTDADGNRLIMDRIAVDDMTAYGVCDGGIYQVDNQTNTWEQITPELPHTAISFAVDGNTFYIGTKQNGVLRFQRTSR